MESARQSEYWHRGWRHGGRAMRKSIKRLQWRGLDETAENGADEGVEGCSKKRRGLPGGDNQRLENKRGAGWG